MTRQVINRINELEDELKRQTRALGDNPPSSDGLGTRAGGGSGPFDGGSGNAGMASLGPLLQRQNQQIMELKRDIFEIKQTLLSMMPKSGAKNLTRLDEKSTKPTPVYPNIDTLPETDYFFPVGPPGYTAGPPQSGYTTDPGFGPKKRNRRGKKGRGNTFATDGGMYSDGYPLHLMQGPGSPASVQSVPVRGKHVLTGSWEDIRHDTHA